MSSTARSNARRLAQDVNYQFRKLVGRMNDRDSWGIMKKHRQDLRSIVQALNNGGDPEKGVDGARMGSYKLE